MSAVVIGEVLVDLLWRTGTATVSPFPGGSPANVAVGLHRLGRPTTLVTCWGEDPPGALVRDHLLGTGVPVERAESASGRTTLALAYIDPASGGATYEFLASWDPVALPLPPDATLLATGSLAIVVEPGAGRVLTACQEMRSRPGGAVAVDLNVRPGIEPDRAAYRRAAERFVATADLVKASTEDLAWLYPELTPAQAARLLLGQGPRLVVVTDGDRGAAAYAAGAEASVPAPAVRVVDTVGAGDAFQAALLAALLHEEPDGRQLVRLPEDRDGMEQLLRRAVTAGALACERAGANPPGLAELEAALSAQRN